MFVPDVFHRDGPDLGLLADGPGLFAGLTAETHLGHAEGDVTPEALAGLDSALDAAGVRHTSEITPAGPSPERRLRLRLAAEAGEGRRPPPGRPRWARALSVPGPSMRTPFRKQGIMGFWGHFIVARSERPLLEAPVFDGLGRDGRAAAHTLWPRPGGWQTLQLDLDSWNVSRLPALVASTGAPACTAWFYDSDMAHLTGLGTDGRQWEAWLHPDVAAQLRVEDPEDMDDSSVWWSSPEFAEAARLIRAELDAEVPDVAANAIAWAASAGVGVADRARIEEVLRSEEGLAEDVFFDLLDALGFPAAVEPSPER